jgi:hypothetical protein
VEEIKTMKKIMSDILEQNALCVYGNEDKIRSQQGLFWRLQTLNR